MSGLASIETAVARRKTQHKNKWLAFSHCVNGLLVVGFLVLLIGHRLF